MADREQQEDAFLRKTQENRGWKDIQEKTFRRWCNQSLKSRGLQLDNLITGMKDGIALINLLEVLSGKKIKSYNKRPRLPIAQIENNAIAIAFIQREGIKLVNISGEDVQAGNEAIILGLIWSLILHYQISMDGHDDGNARAELLKWVRSKIPEYDVKNFTKDWNDGRTLNALCDALNPGFCPKHRSLPVANQNDKVRNCEDGIRKAHELMNVPPLLDGADLANPAIDQNSVMCYVSQLRDLDPNKFQKLKQPGNDALNSCAYGPGVTHEGLVAGQPAPFVIEIPAESQEKLVVKVTRDGRPLASSGVKLTEKQKGNWDCEYLPEEPGAYEVSVTLDGYHIPGSIFTVIVCADDSIGGEGKVVVFFSSTSSSNKGRKDFFRLSKLFEAKEIHKREDFTPWCPVDVLEKDDREAVFKMAGSRKLPIVFIDDKYIGDFDTCNKLEKSGDLDKLLKKNLEKFQTLRGWRK